MYVICNIDHTLANSFWRDSMLDSGDWNQYHENAKHDKVFKNLANFINSLSSVGYTFIGITNRNERFRALTVEWLVKNRIDIDEILMRPDDNYQKSTELKLDLLKKRFNEDYKKIHFIIDDSEEAILAFFKLGIPTLQIRNVNVNGN
jgi:hypothetical protein